MAKQSANPHDELLLAAVHDIRALLRVNLTSAQMFDRIKGSSLDESGRMLLTEVIGSARHIDTLLGRLSDYANSSHTSGRPVPVEAAIQTAVLGAGDLKVEVRIDLEPGMVKVHPAAVRILSELLDNARKFHEGPPHAVVTVTPAPQGMQIEVTDSGIGIEPAALDSVFEPLVRLHSKDVYPGAGLGLSISQRLTEAVGGTLSIRSAPGVGTTVLLLLPAL